MKRLLLILAAVLMIYMVYNKVTADTIVIPDSAIRLRVIPNSNSVYDQSMKQLVKDYLEKNVYLLVGEDSDIDDARNIIKNNVDNIYDDIEKIFLDNQYNQTFDVNFGYNYFPSKEYKGITYPEGYYESLVVSIGEAKGDNWWCVLFPPLCMMETNDMTEVEYKFFVSDVIKKIFS